MSAISCLNRREEVAVPSWPEELTKTATPPPLVLPEIPAMKVAICPVPMRMVFDSLLAPLLAIYMLLPRALNPTAVLLPPMVLENKASAPTAVLLPPEVLEDKVVSPTPVLSAPVVLASKASTPTAAFLAPVVLFVREANP